MHVKLFWVNNAQIGIFWVLQMCAASLVLSTCAFDGALQAIIVQFFVIWHFLNKNKLQSLHASHTYNIHAHI